jgi:hypothetical protein
MSKFVDINSNNYHNYYHNINNNQYHILCKIYAKQSICNFNWLYTPS